MPLWDLEHWISLRSMYGMPKLSRKNVLQMLVKQTRNDRYFNTSTLDNALLFWVWWLFHLLLKTIFRQWKTHHTCIRLYPFSYICGMGLHNEPYAVEYSKREKKSAREKKKHTSTHFHIFVFIFVCSAFFFLSFSFSHSIFSCFYYHFRSLFVQLLEMYTAGERKTY